MPRGPLPKPPGEKRRRNPPTIPTTKLPAAGRSGPIPKPPSWAPLGIAGTAWWNWAWKTPQAAGWSTGDEMFVARRAGIEDDRAAKRDGPNLDIAEALDLDPDDQTAAVEAIMRTLAALASGKTTLDREARELDDRLGLNPKAMAALRWTIVDEEATPATATQPKTRTRQRRTPMRVLDGGAAS